MSRERIESEINYENEGIQALWNRDNYYICIFRSRIDGEIVIEDANITYLGLVKLSRNDFEKPITQVLSSEMARHVKDLFLAHLMDRENEKIEYMREVDELQGCSIWNVTSKLIANRLLCIGKRIHEYYVSSKQGPLDLSYPSLLVSMTEDKRYKIESYSRELEPYLEYLCVDSGYIVDCAGNDSRFRITQIFDECLRINQTIQYVDAVHIYEKKHSYLMTLIPIMHTDGPKILIIAKQTIRQNYISSRENLEKFSNEFEQYYHSEMLGMCFIECSEGNNFSITVSNACFQRIMKEGDLTEEIIIKSSLFKQCIQTRIVVRGFLKTKTSRELCSSHFVHIIPTVNENKVVRIFLVLDPDNQKTKQANELLLKLTKREREILSYVADGYTNKYISSQLMITEGTVKRIISNGYKKLEISSRVELAKLFMSDY